MRVRLGEVRSGSKAEAINRETGREVSLLIFLYLDLECHNSLRQQLLGVLLT